jgi:hypothetical protein
LSNPTRPDSSGRLIDLLGVGAAGRCNLGVDLAHGELVGIATLGSRPSFLLDPEKYVGKQDFFFGTRAAHSQADGRETVTCLCTAKAGEIIRDGASQLRRKGFHTSGEQRSAGRNACHRNGERHGKIFHPKSGSWNRPRGL